MLAGGTLRHVLLQVFWEGDGAWYRGSVTGYSATTQRHTILYDDNDIERVVLDAVPHRCLNILVNELGQLNELGLTF